MKNSINLKNIYPNICLSFDNYNYKQIDDKFNKLKHDFQVFLDHNKKKINKSRKNFYNLSINKLFKKLISDSANKILNNYKKGFENNSKRFKSAKEIQKYKDKKILLLRLIRKKNSKNNKANLSYNRKIALNNISNLNDLTNNILFGKDYNSISYDNKISFFTNKTLNNQPSFQKRLLMGKTHNTSILKKNNLKIKEKLFPKNNLNDSNINHRNESNKNNYKTISLNEENSIHSNENYKLFNKLFNLKKLKVKIKKFENSLNYYPNSERIHKNEIKPYNFCSKKYLKKNKLNFFNNKIGYHSKFNNIVQRENLNDTNNIYPFNRTQLSFKKDSYKIESDISLNNKENSRSLMSKINSIQKGIKLKKRIIKNKNKIKNIDNYLKSKSQLNEEIEKEIKKDISSYQKKIGNFIFLEGKYLYTSHLSYFREGQKFV